MSSGRRADKLRLAIVPPVLLGACVAVGLPPTKSVSVTPQVQVMDDVTVEVSAAPPGEPLPGLKESLEPKEPKVQVGAFTRRIDRALIEARGAPRDEAGLDAAALQAAATFDNGEWSGDPRRELLAYLRRGSVEEGAEFTESDARTVARLQAGSGALADGKLRDETMAVLFAMGFRFSGRKVMAWRVKLEFYPAEIENLDAWNREIHEKVTKNGGSYPDVDPPEGEGSLYVRIGRSLVASYRARGGPPSPIYDDAKHVAAPTKPGVYRLGPPHAHVTSNWYYSQIPWGAEIRRNDDGYQYRWPRSSEWWWATSKPAGTLKMPLEDADFEGLPEVTRDGGTFLIWNKNDFGPIAWNLVPSDLYVHTTPDTEAGTRPPGAARSLTCSHGCVHIDPRERDEMMKSGYLGTDIAFVVRRWDEHLLPDQVRHDMVKGTGVASKS